MDEKQQALHRAKALCQRAFIEVAPKLYAAGPGDESGGELTDDQRNELLKKLAAGEYVAVDIDLLAFEQQDGIENRNFIRFRNESIIAMGATGVGKPFLKDHEQYDSMSVAGRILTSKGAKLGDGDYQIRQRARLTAAWAVDLALRNLLFAVSIGFEPTGPTMCSACQADVYRFSSWWPCHWPGDRVTETPQLDGSKKFVRDPKGVLQVKWIYTKADLIETSMCPIGAVKMAGVDGVRAALSAAGFAIPDEDSPDPVLEIMRQIERAAAPNPNESTRLTPKPEGVHMTNLEAAFDAHGKLTADERKTFAAKLQAEIDAGLAADPVVYTTKDGTQLRQSDGAVALMLAKQADAAADREVAALERENASKLAAAQAALAARAKEQLTAKGLQGSADVHAKILGAVEALNDAECLRTLTAWANGGVAKLAPGVNPEQPPEVDDPKAKLNASLAEFAKAKGVGIPAATADFLRTAEGAALYAAAYPSTKN